MAFGSCVFSSAVLVLLVGSARGGSAKEQDVACASNTAHASLLQKATQRQEKSGLVQEPPQCPVCAAGQQCYCTRESCTCIMQGLLGSSTPTLAVDPTRLPPAPQPAASFAPCTGATAQGRCWYLSEIGDTCAATCAKYGRSFSFVLADPARPLTPILVNHEPQTKQQSWAALECYAPGEDRYHTANANAAKHHTNDEMGAWAHEECKLSCPCGEQLGPLSSASNSVPAVNAQCSWIPPSTCAPQFMYQGVVYAGCAEVDSEHNTAWCQHSFQHTTETGPGVLQDWSYCTSSCGSEPATVPTQTACVWNPAASCIKEFDYEGTHYVGCTTTDHETPWCSNANPYQGSWNHCVYNCGDTTTPIKDDDLLCMWQPKQECSKSFKYKGVDYTGCATVDHPTPWCSHDRVHKGSWTTCTKTCSGASGPALPAEPEDPCTRHPERMTQLKNDAIGVSATLDEAGYMTTASADSPLNMKRFICRVVDKIGCRVTDVSSLMAFVPSYSSLVNRRAYVRLEAELAALCHAGGKWVVFKEPAR